MSSFTIEMESVAVSPVTDRGASSPEMLRSYDAPEPTNGTVGGASLFNPDSA